MSSAHLSPDAIASYPRLSHGERWSLFQHAQECRVCGTAFLTAWNLLPQSTPPPPMTNLEVVLARVAEADDRLSRERHRAPDLVRELIKHPHARRLTLVRNSRRFGSWGLCEALLTAVQEAAYREPEEAANLAHVAQEVASRLDEATYGTALTHDFRCRSWTALGHALFVVTDLHGSDSALERASSELACGTGDPLLAAQVAYYRGVLRGAQRRFGEAHKDLDHAIAAYRRLGDRHLQAKGMIVKASVLSKAGDPEAALALHRKAIPMVDAAREPRVLLAAKHNLLSELVDCGRSEEALALVDEVRALHEQAGERVNRLRLDWIEGQLRQQLHDFDAAEPILQGLRREFLELGMPYDVALVSLELATLYAEQGRTAEIKYLALEMIPIFQALEIQRETIAALLLFRQAAEAETASLALIQHIAGFLKRAQHDPAARFSPPV